MSLLPSASSSRRPPCQPLLLSSQSHATHRRCLSGRLQKYRLHSISGPLISIPSDNAVCQIPTSGDKIMLYFTSLRGIWKTYCCLVRMIFRGLRVPVVERDISMDSAYRKELKDALGEKPVTLPRVFIKGKHVGGADKIKLARLVEGFPVLKDSGLVCDSCGDARFVPCTSCSGSRKLFKKEEGKTRRCPNCSENGLIRCPACCP